MAEIAIRLQTMKYPSPNDVMVCLPLSEDLINRAFVPVDLPDTSADPITREMICTSSAKIAEVKMERKKAAKIISEAVTSALLDAMGMKDTVMGYDT